MSKKLRQEYFKQYEETKTYWDAGAIPPEHRFFVALRVLLGKRILLEKIQTPLKDSLTKKVVHKSSHE